MSAGIKCPLDGQVRNIGDTHGMYQYYLKIVPTQLRTLKGELLESNQYAVTGKKPNHSHKPK